MDSAEKEIGHYYKLGGKMRNNKFGCLGFVLVIFLIIGVFIFNVSANYNEHTYTVTITDKERVNDEDSSKYLVFGEDIKTGETRVFQNTDSFIRGKFNSSNVYGSLKEGETYTITVVGYRIPLFSWYENIIKYEKESNK